MRRGAAAARDVDLPRAAASPSDSKSRGAAARTSRRRSLCVSSRRRGCRVDRPRVAAPPRVPRGSSEWTGRGDARLPRGSSEGAPRDLSPLFSLRELSPRSPPLATRGGAAARATGGWLSPPSALVPLRSAAERSERAASALRASPTPRRRRAAGSPLGRSAFDVRCFSRRTEPPSAAAAPLDACCAAAVLRRGPGGATPRPRVACSDWARALQLRSYGRVAAARRQRFEDAGLAREPAGRSA